MTTAYWWRGDYGEKRNFGDELTWLLLSHFADIAVTWAEPEDADIICSGSTLDVMPRTGWCGIVIGAGQLHESTVTDLSYATVLGLRGRLTADRVIRAKHAKLPIIGDPGLLCSEMTTPTVNKYEIGCIPHLTDGALFPKELANARKYGYPEPHFIDVTDDPIQVITEIGSCRKIIASSLHGLIVADAFGLPRRAEMFPGMINNAMHEGNEFKWHDYASAIGQSIVFGTLQTAPKIRVEEIQRDLFNVFTTLREIFNVS